MLGGVVGDVSVGGLLLLSVREYGLAGSQMVPQPSF